MAKLIVKIDIGEHRLGVRGSSLRTEVEADRTARESWFSLEDGERILVDEAYLIRSRADDSFFAFEFVGVEE